VEVIKGRGNQVDPLGETKRKEKKKIVSANEPGEGG